MHVRWPPSADRDTKQILRQTTRQHLFDTVLDLVATTVAAIEPVEHEDAAGYILTVYVYWTADRSASYPDTSGSSTPPAATTT